MNFFEREFDAQSATTQWPLLLRFKIFSVEITNFTVNLTEKYAFPSALNYKMMYFTVHITVISPQSFFTF